LSGVREDAAGTSTSRYRFSRATAVWGCLGGFLGILVLGYLAILSASGYLPMRQFNSAKWKAQAERNLRVQMIESLQWSYTLKGMRRAEILSLLGPPDDTSYFREWDYVYWLGDERDLLSIDSEWLVLRFGKNGRVSEWAVVRD